jgi:hypothetical protein
MIGAYQSILLLLLLLLLLFTLYIDLAKLRCKRYIILNLSSRRHGHMISFFLYYIFSLHNLSFHTRISSIIELKNNLSSQPVQRNF